MARATLYVIGFLLAASAHAQAPSAKMQCKATGEDFVYDCLIRLSRGGRPLENAGVVVAADMPSMPMAHSVRPARARPGAGPGEYRVRLDLEMLGEWAIMLRLSGPVRDQLVLHYEFDGAGAVPRQR